ncbi:ubiquinone/menaquinone biosynthesis C-methylase UbiE [Psychromicrobium silvestre]|uniref:Ubiquinone/menaquinone biosynthesis C-methylase UbiE n=1 Tax=Psychromicrobium silvestre TaxID=1645614 RepID=A0A7Y9S7V2_9MICC|nr:class I SAM-dependent methyltransferase [Psychromicrobium silvestre]NYE95900.1 ubiquinone/menaquinone biosynthesis C-methylase UbiE [Psychromicrobium silvestre]
MAPHTHPHRHGSIAELLDLDAQVLHQYLRGLMAWLKAQVELPASRILDIGAGTGTGTIALAQQFANAEVIALDISPEMLDHIQARATANNLSSRVSTVQMDLDGGWPELGFFDLAWSSSALHELANPGHTFNNLFRVLNPGGLAVVVEMGTHPRFLEDTTSEGLETRIRGLLRETGREQADHPEWSENLERAGFTLLEKKSFSIDLALNGDSVGGRYAQTYFQRIQPFIAPQLSTSDCSALETLLADHGAQSLLHRDDLRLRAERTAWAASRP